jgi:hypothetical protein
LASAGGAAATCRFESWNIAVRVTYRAAFANPGSAKSGRRIADGRQMHGGTSPGGPLGAANGDSWASRRTQEVKAARREASALVRTWAKDLQARHENAADPKTGGV